MSQEKYIEVLNELIEGIESGDFDNIDEVSEKYTYKYLNALFLFNSYIEGGATLFRNLHKVVCECGKHAIDKKVSKGEKIKIAFLVMSAAEWPAETLYHLLEQDDRFDNYIIICPWNDRSENDILHIYRQTCAFFDARAYKVCKTYDVDEKKYLSWDEIGGVPDVLVHVSSWYESISERYWLEELPLKCVNIYIPYAFYVADNKLGTYMPSCVYNKQIMNLVHRVYADSLINYWGYQEHQLLKGSNVRYSGYAKMDFFYQQKTYDENLIRSIWKIPIDLSYTTIKKVIIAPHHAISKDSLVAYSTFHKNAFFWEYLAKKYADKVTFIFKPHPNLRMKSVQGGLFDTFEEYDLYLERLNALPNVKVVQEDSYLEIFDTSDAMIMDSGSFLAEYLYVNKPLLFLRRKEQAFNELGTKIIKSYYTANGEDYTEIESFLQRVVVEEKDEMLVERVESWKDYLDYLSYNGCLASEYVYDDICTMLGLKNE